jgi:hypothetical protein
MREHGIDMPDPVVKTVDGGGGGETQVAINVDAGGGPGYQKPNQKDMEAANKECQHFMSDGGGTFTPPSPEDQARMQEQALAFAKCMRDHGVDMPDPQFSGDGNFSIGFTTADGSSNSGGPQFDPNSKEFKDANEACGGQDGGAFSVSSGTVPG